MIEGGIVQWAVGSNGILRPLVVGNEYNAVTILPATGTGSLTLCTGAPGYVLTNIGVQVDTTATIAASGMVSLIFSDSSYGTMANYRWYIPQNITGSTQPINDRVVNGFGFYWNNRVANSTLSFHIDTALTAGSIRAFARFAYVNFLG